MKYRTLGRLNVSVVGLGTMSWPGCRYGVLGYSPSSEDIASVQDMVRAALDDGINLIDTAEGFRMMAHGANDLAIGDKVTARYQQFTGRLVLFFERIPA